MVKNNFILAGFKLVLFLIAAFLMSSCGERKLKSLEIEEINNDQIFGITEFIDTDQNNSLQENDNLFQVEELSDSSLALVTTSTKSNIHSHLDLGISLRSMTYSGSMMGSDSKSGMGVTFLSKYPLSDDYYRLRTYAGRAFELSGHGRGVACDGIKSDIIPKAGAWYKYEVQVQVKEDQTQISAAIWDASKDRNTAEILVCQDKSSSRLKEGTIGVWAHGAGKKHWSDFNLAFNPFFDSDKDDEDEVIEPAPTPPKVPVKIVSAKSSSDDGNVASNSIDGNLASRWSAYGKGQTLDLMFDRVGSIDGLRIAIYKGDGQRNSFQLARIREDGSIDQMKSFESSGTSDGFLEYAFSIKDAAGVRFIGQGNTRNLWNSVSEAEVIHGTVNEQEPPQSTPAPTPNPEPTPNPMPTDDLPQLAGRPGSSNTGLNEKDCPEIKTRSLKVVSGLTLTSADRGKTYSYLQINGAVKVKADAYDVVLKCSRINTGTYHAISVDKNDRGADRFKMYNLEISGPKSSGVYGSDFSIFNSEVSDTGSDGIKPFYNVIIQGNWFHHLGYLSTAHADAVQMVVGKNVTIRGNFIDNSNNSGYKSATTAMIQTNNGPVDNVLIEKNYIFGSGNFAVHVNNKYATYKDKSGKTNYGGPTNTRILNNHFLGEFKYGEITTRDVGAGFKRQGNIDENGKLMD